MFRPNSPHARFFARVLVILPAMLALWWFVLLGPMLDALRLESNALLRLMPGATEVHEITVDPSGDWVMRLPVPAAVAAKMGAANAGATQFRSITLPMPRRIPNLLTLALPLFFAVLLAAPRASRPWRVVLLGSAILIPLAPLSLLICGAKIVRNQLFATSTHPVAVALDYGEYLSTAVIPYIVPVIVAVALHRELRGLVLTGEEPERAVESDNTPATPKSGRGRYRGGAPA